MLIDNLTAVLPPPVTPRETGSTTAWGEVYSRLGEVVPGDYMQFIGRYGTGQIGEFLTVLNPFAENRHANLLIAGFEFLGALRTMRTEFPDTVPYPLYFEPGGLLPWGISIDGDIFCWSTFGLSGNWTTVVIGRRTAPEQFALPMSQFLRGVLTSELKALAWPAWVPPQFASKS